MAPRRPAASFWPDPLLRAHPPCRCPPRTFAPFAPCCLESSAQTPLRCGPGAAAHRLRITRPRAPRHLPPPARIRFQGTAPQAAALRAHPNPGRPAAPLPLPLRARAPLLGPRAVAARRARTGAVVGARARTPRPGRRPRAGRRGRAGGPMLGAHIRAPCAGPSLLPPAPLRVRAPALRECLPMPASWAPRSATPSRVCCVCAAPRHPATPLFPPRRRRLRRRRRRTRRARPQRGGGGALRAHTK
jgi:hypothetical protein